jgi:hypothetical protein
MPVSYVDLENELVDVGKEVDMLASGLVIFETSAADADPAWSWLAVQGLASGVEKIYTGCERIMAMIAADLDGARLEHSEGWHISLLKRMANPFPGVRAAVISEQTYKALDQLRSFRHRERNTYGLILDVDIVVDRANQTKQAFVEFRADVAALIAAMRSSDPTGNAGSS